MPSITFGPIKSSPHVALSPIPLPPEHPYYCPETLLSSTLTSSLVIQDPTSVGMFAMPLTPNSSQDTWSSSAVSSVDSPLSTDISDVSGYPIPLNTELQESIDEVFEEYLNLETVAWFARGDENQSIDTHFEI